MNITKVTHLFLLGAILACLSAASGLASAANTPLRADQAFQFSLSVKNPSELEARWTIAPGYYLYQQRVHINVDNNVAADIRYPKGEVRYDEIRGRFDAYAGHIVIPIMLKTPASALHVTVDYQGCSKAGFCYPLIHKSMMISMTNASETPATVSLQSLSQNQNGVRALFDTEYLGVILLIFTGLGLLLAFTPCVLPMIPILTGIIVGQKHKTSTMKAFVLSSIYVIGSALTYALAGLTAALMGNSLQAWLQQPGIIIFVSGMFALLAFSLLGLYDLRLPRKLQNRILD